jgi:hypothetical protein
MHGGSSILTNTKELIQAVALTPLPPLPLSARILFLSLVKVAFPLRACHFANLQATRAHCVCTLIGMQLHCALCHYWPAIKLDKATETAGHVCCEQNIHFCEIWSFHNGDSEVHSRLVRDAM